MHTKMHAGMATVAMGGPVPRVEIRPLRLLEVVSMSVTLVVSLSLARFGSRVVTTTSLNEQCPACNT
jgi:hypothetical protein